MEIRLVHPIGFYFAPEYGSSGRRISWRGNGRANSPYFVVLAYHHDVYTPPDDKTLFFVRQTWRRGGAPKRARLPVYLLLVPRPLGSHTRVTFPQPTP